MSVVRGSGQLHTNWNIVNYLRHENLEEVAVRLMGKFLLQQEQEQEHKKMECEELSSPEFEEDAKSEEMECEEALAQSLSPLFSLKRKRGECDGDHIRKRRTTKEEKRRVGNLFAKFAS